MLYFDIYKFGRFHMKRADRRAWDELRPVKIIPGFQNFAEGSALIELGQTRVLCSVSVDERVPGFLKGEGGGWITAEYAMLPRATVTRTTRDSGRLGGRSQEIQRLIGRSLRAVTELTALGERTLTVDCDVIQADGGTRTAAITGSYVALYQALQTLANMGVLSTIPLKSAVAATSVGIVHSYMLLDLCYDEDYNAEVDFNVVMTSKGEFVEIQGTAETKPFSKETIDSLLTLAEKGIKELFQIQQAALEAIKIR
jgi:ribonuclease PH